MHKRWLIALPLCVFVFGNFAAATAAGPKSTTAFRVANGLPVRLRIPILNVDAAFQYTGLKPDGTMEIPTTVVDVGWFTGSARPGQKGTAIITGHIARIRKSIVTKQGVFYNLNRLRPGNKLYVLNDKGESIAFTVRETHLYDPAADATRVFASEDNGAHLNLITCEGAWNQTKLSYTKRLVVFTDETE
jgi:LPXTG-site transpeptidase (sortase) family protein